jgi:hypothetical protein
MCGTSSQSAGRSAYAAPTATMNIARKNNNAARLVNAANERRPLGKFSTFTPSFAMH